jgi:hypothetical protein
VAEVVLLVLVVSLFILPDFFGSVLVFKPAWQLEFKSITPTNISIIKIEINFFMVVFTSYL